MILDHYSDYGSGSSTGSATPWLYCEPRPTQTHPKSEQLPPKSTSYLDLVTGKCTLEDVMRDFELNGSDSPYDPDEDKRWAHPTGALSGMGPAGAYLRQKSWPAPERSPVPRLPRPRSHHDGGRLYDFATSTPIFGAGAAPAPEPAPFPEEAGVTREQARVLTSLPDSVLYSLLRGLHSERRAKVPQECRFCKNNGELESYYRSHVLKDAAGHVACPVLRAFVCRRCGASGDTAHTIKYCPLSTNEERIKSAAMLRSIRMSSGRKRHSFPFPSPPPSGPPLVWNSCEDAQLDPRWAALEQKLSL